MLKIICVGHQKTGTTSIEFALQSLGYSVGLLQYWKKTMQFRIPPALFCTENWMYGVDQLTGNENVIRQIYEDKINEIIEYFKHRPDDFLKPFPHTNKAGAGWDSNKNRRRRANMLRIFYVVVIIVLLVIWAYQ